MSYTSLLNYYETNHVLHSEHKYSLDVIENMFPFERDLYIDLTLKNIKEDHTKQVAAPED